MLQIIRKAGGIMRRTKVKKRSNKAISIVICVLVMAICLVFFIRSNEPKAQNEEAGNRIEQVESEIEKEKERTNLLEEYAKYVNTKQYVEDMAREKLGLIYPGELIFKAD